MIIKKSIIIVFITFLTFFVCVQKSRAGYWEIQGEKNGSCNGPTGICSGGETRVCVDPPCPGQEGANDGGGGDGGGGGGGTAAAAAPACVAQTFAKASVAPSTVRPLDEVTVTCDYGKKLDCLSVTGAGFSSCRYSRYEGTNHIFLCTVGTTGGYYDDTKCVLKAGTASNCCAASNKAGDMNIVGAEARFDQDIVLPFGAYTLSARVYSVIAKNKGNKVSLLCNSDTCANSTVKGGEVASIVFAAGTDFVSQSKALSLTGTGDDRHYLLRVSSDRGSEAYFDTVSLKNGAGREYVVNGDFSSTVNGTVSTQQPTSWGEGDNKSGYYYGSVSGSKTTQGNISTTTGGGTTGNTPTPTSGPTPTPGKATAVSLNLKIKLQGVTKKPAKADPIAVQVKLAGTNLTTAQTKSAQFTVNDAGEWSGKVDFEGVPTGGGYIVYVKGPKHVQKKICDASPTEAKGGTYHCSTGAIVLQAGANTLDFTKIIQMGGDLPETGGKQNGIIDAYDTTFIRTNLGSTDATKVAVGDLNYDGGIDTQDYSMILQSLSIKFDEE